MKTRPVNKPLMIVVSCLTLKRSTKQHELVTRVLLVLFVDRFQRNRFINSSQRPWALSIKSVTSRTAPRPPLTSVT